MMLKVIIEKWKKGIWHAKLTDLEFYHFDEVELRYVPNIERIECDIDICDNDVNYDELVKAEIDFENFDLERFLDYKTKECIKNAIKCAYAVLNMTFSVYHNVENVQAVSVQFENGLAIQLGVDPTSGRLTFWNADAHLI